jgi:outer membrane protein TolC
MSSAHRRPRIHTGAGPLLQAQAEVAMNQLAVLTGQSPGALDATLAAPAPLPTMPQSVAVGDPAALIARRPDVRAAERALAASTAQIGVNKARLLPTISFTGILGLGGSSRRHVRSLDVGCGHPASAQMGRARLGQGRPRRQSEAQRDTAEAQYRHTVLSALEDAESSLSRFGASRCGWRIWRRARARPRATPPLAHSGWRRARHRRWNRPSARTRRCRPASTPRRRAPICW